MKTIATYKILPNLKLVLENYIGDLHIDDYIAFKTKIINDTCFSSNFNFLISFKKTNFLINEKDIEKYVQFIDNQINNLGKRRSAIVTKTPNQVVKTTMYKMMQKNKTQQVDIFSTFAVALNWLEIDYNLVKSELKTFF